MTTKPLVLLTGINGYVGAHVLKQLLSTNYCVRGIVRSASKSAFYLNKYSTAAPHALDSVVQDVDYIVHLASPYFVVSDDPIHELVNPAVDATKNVLQSAVDHAHRLKRLTLLSSFAAVNDIFQAPRPGYVYSERDWDPITMQQAGEDGSKGYHASKTFAERAAWELWDAARQGGQIRWDLVALNPPMIYGPPEHEVDVGKGDRGAEYLAAGDDDGVDGAIAGFPGHGGDARAADVGRRAGCR